MIPREGPAEAPRFEAGQTWRYRTRALEPQSRLTILQVDGATAHVHLRGIRLRTSSGRRVESIFLPIAVKVLARSVVALEPRRDRAFAALREEWLAHHDTRGRGHVTVEPRRFLAMFDQMSYVESEDGSVC